MMFGRLFKPRVHRELEAARKESKEAREQLVRKLRRAEEDGVTVQLSRAALQRIVKIEASS